MPRPLVSSLMFPELERQLSLDRSIWPNIHGLYIINVQKRRKPVATWYLIFQGDGVQPIITASESTARRVAGRRLRVVRIQVEDRDVLNFITGGLTGVKAYMSRKIKIKGDLVLAQKLEQVFEKAGGRERALDFIRQHEQELYATNKAML